MNKSEIIEDNKENIMNTSVETASHDTLKIKKKKKNLFLKVLKKHKIKILIIMFLMLVSSTWAWFVYNKVVDFRLVAHVKTWKVNLGEEDETGEEYVFEVTDLYPGMLEFIDDDLTIANDGEVNAAVTVTIKKITLFGEEIAITGGSSLNEVFANYPFKATMKLQAINADGSFGTEYDLSGNADVVMGSNTNYRFLLSVTWPFECSKEDGSACTQEEIDAWDEIDTEYGLKSYAFELEKAKEGSIYADMSSLQIELGIHAIQTN